MRMLLREVPAKLLLFFFSAALISSCEPAGQIFPTETPTPPAETPVVTATRVWFPSTATPTVYVPPTVTQQPEVLPSYGDLLIQDDFTDHLAWLTGSYANGNAAYSINALNLAVAELGGTVTSFRKETYFTDQYWEITLTPNLCTPIDTYGLIFWSVNKQTYHQLAFNCNGEFSIQKVKNGRSTPLTDWIPSSQVPRGGLSSMRVGLWIGGGLVRVLLNDQLQAGVYILPATGGIGIFATSNGGPAVNVSFSDMQIYTVNRGDYPPTPTPTVHPTNTPYPTQPKPNGK